MFSSQLLFSANLFVDLVVGFKMRSAVSSCMTPCGGGHILPLVLVQCKAYELRLPGKNASTVLFCVLSRVIAQQCRLVHRQFVYNLTMIPYSTNGY